MKNTTINKNSYDVFGKLLVKVQFFEQLVKIFVSLLNKDIKSKNKAISNLCYKDILNDDIPKRKQTLGVLMIAVKNVIKSFDNKEFEELLEKRNIFIHKLHKIYLSNDIKNNNTDEDLEKFILELWNLTDKYTDIFTGLISLSTKFITNNKINLSGIEEYEKDLLKFLE